MQLLNFLFLIGFADPAVGFGTHMFGLGRLHRTGIAPLSMSLDVSGRVVVTGLGAVPEDEFMLNLLNEQNEKWDSIVLATEDPVVTRKRFLTRTGRYTGLQNLLEYTSVSMENSTSLSVALEGASTLLCFDLPRESVDEVSALALEAGVSRMVATTTLPLDTVMQMTELPEFKSAAAAFKAAGGAFTGLRHGEIVAGDEYNAYEISNSSTPCADSIVERGVLARLVAELLSLEESANEQCGVSTGGAFAAAYLNILRSSGLTRNQEVMKMYKGGLQRVAQLTAAEQEAQAKAEEETAARKATLKAEREAEELAEKEAAAAAAEKEAAKTKSRGTTMVHSTDPDASFTPGWDEEDEEEEPSDEEKIEERARDILQSVWREMDARMYTKSTTKLEFFGTNREMAMDLARTELKEEQVREVEAQREEETKRMVREKMSDVKRQQYAKLLSLERAEMENQKEISDIWVKYIFLLIETTLLRCEEEGLLFHNMDEFAQTMLLRKRANELREACGLSPYDVVYDPLDASVIVKQMQAEPIGKELGLDDAASVANLLNQRHESLLQNVAALRGAAQIIELALETLRQELPPPPPSVDELRRSESMEKQGAVSASRLDAIRNRGQPASEESAVGRL